jgi:hypothetical protein
VVVRTAWQCRGRPPPRSVPQADYPLAAIRARSHAAFAFSLAGTRIPQEILAVNAGMSRESAAIPRGVRGVSPRNTLFHHLLWGCRIAAPSRLLKRQHPAAVNHQRHSLMRQTRSQGPDLQVTYLISLRVEQTFPCYLAEERPAIGRAGHPSVFYRL